MTIRGGTEPLAQQRAAPLPRWRAREQRAATGPVSQFFSPGPICAHQRSRPRRHRAHRDHQGTCRCHAVRHRSVDRRDQHHHEAGNRRAAALDCRRTSERATCAIPRTVPHELRSSTPPETSSRSTSWSARTPAARRSSVAGRSQQYHLGVGGGTGAALATTSPAGTRPATASSGGTSRKQTARLNVTLVPGSKLTLNASLGYAGRADAPEPRGRPRGPHRVPSNAHPRNLPGGGGDTTRRGFVRGLPRSTTCW